MHPRKRDRDKFCFASLKRGFCLFMTREFPRSEKETVFESSIADDQWFHFV